MQCKQSQFLIIPAHVLSWTHFDVLPQRPPRPALPRSQTVALRASRGSGQIAGAEQSGGLGQRRGGSPRPSRTLRRSPRNLKWRRVNWVFSQLPGVLYLQTMLLKEPSEVNPSAPPPISTPSLPPPSLFSCVPRPKRKKDWSARKQRKSRWF